MWLESTPSLLPSLVKRGPAQCQLAEPDAGAPYGWALRRQADGRPATNCAAKPCTPLNITHCKLARRGARPHVQVGGWCPPQLRHTHRAPFVHSGRRAGNWRCGTSSDRQRHRSPGMLTSKQNTDCGRMTRIVQARAAPHPPCRPDACAHGSHMLPRGRSARGIPCTRRADAAPPNRAEASCEAQFAHRRPFTKTDTSYRTVMARESHLISEPSNLTTRAPAQNTERLPCHEMAG